MADAGDILLWFVAILTIVMVVLIYANGDLPYFEDHMAVKILDKFTDERTGKMFVDLQKPFAENVTYQVRTDTIYKELSPGTIYYVSYSKPHYTITDAYVCDKNIPCRWVGTG
jgi:hypothetical protein